MSTKRSSRSSTATEASESTKGEEQKAVNESKIFLIKKSLVAEENLEIVNITHPRTGSAAKFLIHEGQIYEITCFQERYRSWFIGQSAAANGNVYMTTLVDPLFLTLPLLTSECTDRAVPIDQLFTDSDTVRNGRLLEVLTDEQLNLVADIKRSGEIKALKYNEEKVISWLARKCEKLTPKLIEHKIHCGTSATSANFVKSEKLEEEKNNKDEVLRYAYFIVADYLSEDLAQRLLKKLGIELKAEGKPTKAKKVDGRASLKRSLSGDDDEIKDEKPAKKIAAEAKVSSKTKAMAKAASGTKSISSFFKKP